MAVDPDTGVVTDPTDGAVQIGPTRDEALAALEAQTLGAQEASMGVGPSSPEAQAAMGMADVESAVGASSAAAEAAMGMADTEADTEAEAEAEVATGGLIPKRKRKKKKKRSGLASR